MSGNCATGMRSSDSTPASVIRMAMTMASRGRSTKTAEIMLLARRPRCCWWRCGGTRCHLDARAYTLDAFQDDHVAVVESGRDHCGGRRRLAKLDTALFDAV